MTSASIGIVLLYYQLNIWNWKDKKIVFVSISDIGLSKTIFSIGFMGSTILSRGSKESTTFHRVYYCL